MEEDLSITLGCMCLSPPQEKLKALVWQCQAFQESPTEMEALWSTCATLLYSLDDKHKQLGLGDKARVQMP